MLRAVILSCVGFLTNWSTVNADSSALNYSYKKTVEIVTLVEKAAGLIEKEGEKAFPLFRKRGSQWFYGDTYIFVYDLNGKNIFHPVQPELEGKNLIDLRDINGKPVIEMIVNKARNHDKPYGWVHYMWIRPDELFPMWKSSYIVGARTPSGAIYAVGSGVYNLKVENQFIVEMVDEAVELIDREGKAAFSKFRDKSREFGFLDSYIFILDQNGRAVVDPAFPSLQGRDLRDFKDAAGKHVVREMIEKLSGDTTWISYMRPKPGEIKPARRLAYLRKVRLGEETFIVGSGLSPARPIWMR